MNEKRLFRVILIAGIIVFAIIPLIAFVVSEASNIVYPAIAGLLVAYLLYPIIRWTYRIGIPKWLTAATIIFIIYFLFIFIIQNFIPTIQKEVKIFNNPEQALTESQSNLLPVIKKVILQLENWNIIEPLDLDDAELVDKITQSLSSMLPVQEIFASLTSLIGRIFTVTLIFSFVLFYGLIDGDKLYKSCIGLIPNEFYEAGVLGVNRTLVMFGYYIHGVVIETFVLGIIAFILLCIGMIFTEITFILVILIALIIALTNAVRIVGPFIGGLVGALITLTSTADLTSTLFVITVVLLTQLLDSILVLPLIMKDQIKIHPVICLLAVLIGGTIGDDILGRVIGMILAIPFIGGVKVLYNVLTVDMKRFRRKILIEDEK